MYGSCCGLGDMPLKSRFAWGYLSGDLGEDYGYLGDPDYGYLGQDESTTYVDFGPDVPPGVTIQDVATAASSGASWLDSLGTVLQKAGTSVDQVLQQYQIGELAANTPVSQLPVLRAGITGQSSIASVVSSITSSPTLLIGGAVLLYLLLRRK